MDDRNLEDYRLNPPDFEEMPDEPEVEPCPFCGQNPKLDYDYDEWWVECANKECWLSESGYTRVENWNNRSGKESEGECKTTN
jgi:hypothetical protein